MSIEEKIKNAKEDSWLKDSFSEEEFKQIKESVKERYSIIERLRKAEEVFRKNGEQASLEANGIHYAIEIIELEQFTPQTAIKHFGAMECPNCGALFYEVPMIETALEEIKAEINTKLKFYTDSESDSYYLGEKCGLKCALEIIDKHISRK